MPKSKPKVYYARARVTKWNYEASLPGKLEILLGHAALKDRYEKDEWVAVKTHFGSFGAHRIVRPVFIRKVTDAIRVAGGNPFVTDTVRIKGLDYLEVANAGGLNHLSVGAPVVLADGLFGKDSILVEAGGLGQVAVASAIHDASAMVVVSHVKGHINSGYAGAIKNMAMGGISGSHRKCGWKCGRGSMHAIGHGALEWSTDKCDLCYQCQEVCPLECISFGDGKDFAYDDEKCWRCGRCVRVCPSEAIEFEGTDDEEFMRSLSRAASAVAGTFERGKLLYVNFLLEVQPECDCMPGADVPVIQDQGIVLSDDIVAVEQASADILKAASPLPDSAAADSGVREGDDVLLRLNQQDYEIQMEEAEALGLGFRRYELIEI
jgi:uncharacterized Fe-S center protein